MLEDLSNLSKLIMIRERIYRNHLLPIKMRKRDYFAKLIYFYLKNKTLGNKEINYSIFYRIKTALFQAFLFVFSNSGIFEHI